MKVRNICHNEVILNQISMKRVQEGLLGEAEILLLVKQTINFLQ